MSRAFFQDFILDQLSVAEQESVTSVFQAVAAGLRVVLREESEGRV